MINIIGMLFYLFGNRYPNIHIGRSTVLETLNYGSSLVAIGSLYLYYYMHKKNELLLITLVYISNSFETLTTGIFKDYTGLTDVTLYQELILSYLFRTILLTKMLSLKSNNKVLSFNTRYKKDAMCIIFTILITVVLDLISLYMKVGLNIKIPINIEYIILIAFIAYHIYIMYRLAIKAKESGKSMYIIIMASINMFVFNRLYSIELFARKTDLVIFICDWLIFGGYTILIIGIFLECIKLVKESDKSIEELKLFYEICENNKHSNLVMYNEEGKIIYANKLARKELCSIYKNEPLELQYKEIDRYTREMIPRNDFKSILEILSKKDEFNGIVNIKDGRIIKLYIQKIKVNPSYERLVVSFEDKTKEYKMNEKIKMNEAKLKSITGNIKDLIFSVDKNNKIIYVNKSSMDNLGYSLDDLIGKPYDEIVISAQSSSLFLGTSIREEIFKCKNGKTLTLESIVSELKDDNNDYLGKIVVSRDIGFRRQYEKLKLEYNKIKEYDKIRNEFFSNLSHEFKTPINIIYSCLQLLNNTKEVGKEEFFNCYDKYEFTIKQNCYRMIRLINNLLDMTKIGSAFFKMNFVNYDIISLVENITLSVVPYVETKNIYIMFDTEVEELEIKCDPDKIERVMLNLISNAVKFTPENGEIFVDIKVDDEYVYVSVKDTGIGIPEDSRANILDRFIQSDKSLNREKEGTGIGLSLVKSIIDLHKGQVYLKKTSSKGSEFEFKLPNKRMNDKEVSIDKVILNSSKPITEKIELEFSDIYDLKYNR